MNEKSNLMRALLACLLGVFIPWFVCVDVSNSFAADLSEYQKQTVEAIREITLQLILIAMGIFAIVGGFVTGKERPVNCGPILWTAFVLLGISVGAGLLAYGNLIWALGKGGFQPFGVLELLASL